MSEDYIGGIIGPGERGEIDATTESIDKLVESIVRGSKASREFELKIKPDASLTDMVKNINLAVDANGKLVESNKKLTKVIEDDAKRRMALLKEEAQIEKMISAEDLANAKKRTEASKEKVNSAKAVTEAKRQETEATRKDTLETVANAKAATENAKQKQILARYERELQKELERKEALLKKEEALLAKQNSAYNNLKREYNEISLASKDYGVELATLERIYGKSPTLEESKRLNVLRENYKRATLEAQNLHNTLLTVETAVGQTQRNVGNYTNQVFALTQVIRELPSFAYSTATGFLAISNNLPMLADEFGKVVKATGSTTQALKIFGASLFSTTNIITLVITAITILTARTASAAQSFKVSSEEFLKQGELYNKLATKTSENFAKQAAQLDILKRRFFDAAATVKDKQIVVDELNESYGKTIGKIKNINEAEDFFVNRSAAFVEALKIRASISGAYDLIAENQKKVLELQAQDASKTVSFLQKTTNGFNAFYDAVMSKQADKLSFGQAYDSLNKKTAQRVVNNTQNNADAASRVISQFILDNQQKLSKLQQDFKFDFTDELKDPKPKKQPKPLDLTNEKLSAEKNLNEEQAKLLNSRIQRDIEAQRTIFEDEKQTLDKRLAAYLKYDALLQKQVEVTAASELRTINAKLQKIEEIEKKPLNARTNEEKALLLSKEAYLVERLRITEEANAEEAEIEREGAKTMRGIVESSQKQTLEIIYGRMASEAAAVKQGYNDQLIALNTQLDKQEITEKQYRQRRKELLQASDKAVYEAQKRVVSDFLAELEREGNVSVDVIQKLKNELASLEPPQTSGKKEGSFLGNLLGIDPDDPAGSELVQLVSRAVKEMYDAVGDIVDAQFEKQISVHEERLKQIQKERDASVEAANSTTEIELAKINATYSTKEDRLKAITQFEISKKEELNRINAEAHTREVQEQNEIRRIKRQQAISQKAFDMAEIVAKTGIAIMEALKIPVYGEGKALAIGAIGLAQLIKVAAQPIPEYAEGTEDHPGGGAIVGEGKHSELVQEPGKKPYIVSKPTFIENLAKHSKVIPLSKVPMEEIMAAQMGMMNPYLFASLQDQKEDRAQTIDIEAMTAAITTELQKNGYVISQAIRDNAPVSDWYSIWKGNATQTSFK